MESRSDACLDAQRKNPTCRLSVVVALIFCCVYLLKRCHTDFVVDPVQLIGGNTTATDAAFLAEYFHSSGVKTSVVGVPCTISGGMKNNFVVSSLFVLSSLVCLMVCWCFFLV